MLVVVIMVNGVNTSKVLIDNGYFEDFKGGGFK